MKAQMSLPANMIGWIITLSIFVGGMIVLFAFWYSFQTLPNEPVEKSTACDFGYMISLWDMATVYPNIFNRTFLREWDKEGTADILFENMSDDFFLSSSDYFVYISDGEEVHSLYIPPESRSVFETCSQLHMLPEEKKKLEGYAKLLEALPSGGDINEIEEYGGEEDYRTKLTHYNELHSICPLITFVADETTEDVKVEAMVAGMTTNLATREKKYCSL
ncbi:MAG: hypothetical protein KAU95_03560, partial [Candidatus Aenigmarchaeota archaeon]|nr:hypothetical protein [Candidatus Aenigmarchaeota archaeon]